MESRNWIKRVIYYQEKKTYHLFTILIFAIFVGMARALLEVMLSGQEYYGLHVLHCFAFYFLMIWSYTLVASVMTKVDWRKAINAVLIGVFLGMFPPLIDVFIYGMGNFSYRYIFELSSPRSLLLFDPEHGIPIGEGLVVWSTIMFTGYYVYLKTRSLTKAFLGGALAYGMNVILTGMITPMLTIRINKLLVMDNSMMMSILHMAEAIVIYLILNPHIFKSLLVRSIHCIPFVLLTFLGAELAGGFMPLVILMAAMVYYAGLTTLVQNDFFDQKEDDISGRTMVFQKEDVAFFNAVYIILLFLIYNLGGLLFLPLTLLFIGAVLYNYDFYRAKRFFPANYKIEGLWGLGAFLAGIIIRGQPAFTFQVCIYCFLVFGGWSLVSTFKDYKDIEADRAVGNQTGYIMLMRAGLSLEKAHMTVSVVLIACFLVPVVWLFFQDLPNTVVVMFALITLTPFVFALRMPPGRAAVMSILGVTCLYLMALLFLLAVYYKMPVTAPPAIIN